jgi:hypothetical protein
MRPSGHKKSAEVCADLGRCNFAEGYQLAAVAARLAMIEIRWARYSAEA